VPVDGQEERSNRLRFLVVVQQPVIQVVTISRQQSALQFSGGEQRFTCSEAALTGGLFRRPELKSAVASFRM
jgi:hypothetical protein